MNKNWVFARLGKDGAKDSVATPVAPVAQAAVVPPAPEDPPEAWAEAVWNAPDKVLAAEWAQRIEGDELLAEVALRSKFAEIRLAAARRITDLGALKRVADASKDKQVHRHCADALRASRQEDTRARRSVELAAAVRELLDAEPIAISHLLLIEKDLAALGEGGAETAECESLLEQARERVLQETQAQIDQRARLAAAEVLLAEVGGADAVSAELLGEWSEQHSALAEAATAAPAWLASLPASRAFAAILEDIEARLIAGGDAIEKALLEDEQRAAEEIERETKLAAEAEAAAQAAQVAANGEPKGRPARKTIASEEIQPLAAALEAHLEEGRVAEAEAALKDIDRRLAGASPTGQVARRLQRARAQLARLAGWARWGTDKAREQLIASAEALLQGEPDVAERARAVPLLRREWKNLDAHGAASQPLWKKFDRALERAYKPVAEQRAVEAAAHEAAKTARLALLDEWDAWYAAGATDLKVVDAKREEIARTWRAAPRAGFRDERQLRKRFDALMGKIDTQLNTARATETTRLKTLVAEAEALKDTPDLGAAMSAAKTLQRRWKDEMTGIRLRHGEDHKFWRRFRTACDAVFARRDAEHAERDAERAKREEERSAALDAVRAADAQKKARHAARFAEMAQKGAPPADAPADALERGRVQRDALLLDLEISLDLPTPETHAAARRTRNLMRLQERFSKAATVAADPETLVKNWYAIPAGSDESQSARMAAVVSRLLESAPQARKVSRS
ncbi:MAG: hypothetical protein ABI630_05990 [Betaproteobacteria bacterium]